MTQVLQPTPAKRVPEEGASSRFQRQRDRILAAATVALNRSGVWGMTLQAVAGALGMQTSSVTYYFRKREHLAVAVFEDTLARLSDMVSQAQQAPGPRQRVRRLVELYFSQHASAIRGESAPLAVLAEIRTMDEEARLALVARYQEIFRAVRGFFGPIDGEDRRDLLTARTQVLVEALHWAGIWLPHFPLADFPSAGERMLDLLDGGLVVGGGPWWADPLDPGDAADDPTQRDYIRTATKLINDHGYKGASVERITAELNRAKPDLYRYTESKDELFAACFRTSTHRIAAVGRLAGERHTQHARQVAHIVSSALALQFNGEFPLLRGAALQAMPPAVRQGAIERFERTAFGLMRLLVGAMQEGAFRILDPFITAQVLLSAVDSSYDLRRWRQAMPADRAVSIYMSVLAGGLFDDR